MRMHPAGISFGLALSGKVRLVPLRLPSQEQVNLEREEWI